MSLNVLTTRICQRSKIEGTHDPNFFMYRLHHSDGSNASEPESNLQIRHRISIPDVAGSDQELRFRGGQRTGLLY
jgi:hypothetical protein